MLPAATPDLCYVRATGVQMIMHRQGLMFSISTPSIWDCIDIPISIVFRNNPRGWFVCETDGISDAPMHRKPYRARDEAIAVVARGFHDTQSAS